MLGQKRQIEAEFFNSLHNLACLYGVKLPACKGLGYPLNIAKSFEKAQGLLQKNMGLELVILKDKSHKSCVATVKTYDTDMRLFYVAVKPLCLLFRDPRQKAKANLLLSVFAYLHQVAGVPYFSDGFLGGEYEMIYEWYTEAQGDFDESDCNEIIETYRSMDYFGKKLFKSIRHKYHLEKFQNRVLGFVPKTKNDRELLAVGKEILDVYLQYPSRNIFEKMQEKFIGPQEEDRISPDQYISFFWDGKGTVYEQLMETVNARFQELSGIDEPMAMQCFDRPQDKEDHDLGFEEKLLGCLGKLSDVLNEI